MNKDTRWDNRWLGLSEEDAMLATRGTLTLDSGDSSTWVNLSLDSKRSTLSKIPLVSDVGVVIYSCDSDSVWMDPEFFAPYLKVSSMCRILLEDEFKVDSEMEKLWLRNTRALASSSVSLEDFFGLWLFDEVKTLCNTCPEISFFMMDYVGDEDAMRARAVLTGSREKALEKWNQELKAHLIWTMREFITDALARYVYKYGSKLSITVQAPDGGRQLKWELRLGDATIVLPPVSAQDLYDKVLAGEDVKQKMIGVLTEVMRKQGW
ncbi:hypothetical protein [Alicyclobacillus sp. SO9]|uniref:hypothetical protein n=1 Tax=Alicyclobacillus sp. SO9 TaxID=2665646 RepID=UPI0018E8C32B|nr:hypothetical protein [Alicyclobacillus sp. SO9]QQE80398.1 hypothetical protein GI364_08265 [Alicyclobacillus sp. SO9]